MLLGTSSGIPAAPLAVAVGIPADLLRRRPDVRRAERQLAAQSARIGVAKADLLPRIQLVGSVALSAEDAAKFFQGRSFEAIGGPRLRLAGAQLRPAHQQRARAGRRASRSWPPLYADTVLAGTAGG